MANREIGKSINTTRKAQHQKALFLRVFEIKCLVREQVTLFLIFFTFQNMCLKKSDFKHKISFGGRGGSQISSKKVSHII